MVGHKWSGWLGGAIVLAVSSGCGGDDAGTEGDDGDGGVDVEADVSEEVEGEAEAEAGEDDAAEAEDGSGVCEERFWIWDLSVMPPVDRQICFSLRGEGDHEHVWVADDQWGTFVDDVMVADILRTWDAETPPESTAPTQGIFDILTGVFGDPPDEFDADPKIHILLYEMGSFGGMEFDGYFRTTDMTTEPTSNRREMIHINTATRHSPSSPYMLGVMAHEFHHMLQWRYDPAEETWLSESLAELAMVLTGFRTDLAAANGWARNPRAPLIVDGVGSPVDYGAAFLFGDYLYDRLSAAGAAALAEDPAHGTASVETAVQLVDSTELFVDFFADFATAVMLDDVTIGDGRNGFLELDPPPGGGTTLTFPAAARTVEIPGGGIALARVTLDGLFHPAIGVDVVPGAGVNVGVRVALIDATAGTQVFAVVPGTHLTLTGVPATATAIGVALATDETLPVGVAISANDE